MGAKQDVQHGVTADVRADRDSVVGACQRAAETLGKHAKVQANAATVTVQILPGMSQTFSSVSPVVGINLSPGRDGHVHLEAGVESHRTVQSTVFGFIPVGPKRLVGRQYYFRFLSALETELAALDPVSGSVQRRQPQSV